MHRSSYSQSLDPRSQLRTSGNNHLNSRRVQSVTRNHQISREQQIFGYEDFIGPYKINSIFARKLSGLNGYEIVLICDDSSSMTSKLGDVSGPYRPAPTRWDELKQTVSIVVDSASPYDPDGVDVYFLNREPILQVRSSQKLVNTFARPPKGKTPIVRVMREILHKKRQQIKDRKLLLLIATDGAPTDDNGRPNINDFRHALEHERIPIDRIPTTIIACTDNKNSMSYLNDWDKQIPHLDVVDDYKSEREQILKIQGRSFPFSFGDYVVKILMGGVDKWFDDLDEKKVSLDDCGRPESAVDVSCRISSNPHSAFQ